MEDRNVAFALLISEMEKSRWGNTTSGLGSWLIYDDKQADPSGQSLYRILRAETDS